MERRERRPEIFFRFRKKFLLRRFFPLVKEKLVKILAPGVGWNTWGGGEREGKGNTLPFSFFSLPREMAAHNRRRKDTSKHALGVWEEFSFLNKGLKGSIFGEEAIFLRRGLGGRRAGLLCCAGFFCPFREWQSTHSEILLKDPKNGDAFIPVRIT